MFLRRSSLTEEKMERTEGRCRRGRGSTRMDPAALRSDAGKVSAWQVCVRGAGPSDYIDRVVILRLQVSQPRLWKRGAPVQHRRRRRRPLGRSGESHGEPERADRGGVGEAAGRHAERPGEAPHPGGSVCQPGQAQNPQKAAFEGRLRTFHRHIHWDERCIFALICAGKVAVSVSDVSINHASEEESGTKAVSSIAASSFAPVTNFMPPALPEAVLVAF